jgi:CheY-like chemotaxis protein
MQKVLSKLVKLARMGVGVLIGTVYAQLDPVANGKKKVLVVEDNADWRELLTMIIRRSGHEVVIAGTGKDAIRQASMTHPDLILMDLGLPEISGDEATVQLKADPSTQHIPVVIQTAFGAGPNAKRAIEAGAAEIMHKPISITDIQKLLSKYLSGGDGKPRTDGRSFTHFFPGSAL